MRILHLIDHAPKGHQPPHEPGGDAAMFACRSLIQHLPDVAHDVCLIGGSNTIEFARAHDLENPLRLSAPAGRALLASRSLRRIIRDRGTPDAVHCWSVATLCLAHWALRNVPRAATLLQRPVPAGAVAPEVTRTRGLGAWILSRALRDTSIVVLSDEARAAWRCAFWSAESIKVAPLPKPMPGMTSDKHNVRRQLGIADDQLILLLLGQTHTQADATRFASLMDVLHRSAPGFVGIIANGAGQLPRGMRLHAGLDQQSRIMVSSSPMPNLLALADVAVCEGNRYSAVSNAANLFTSTAVQIAAAHACGVPVIAPRAIASSTLYPGQAADNCIAFNASLPELARKLLPMRSDQRLLRRLADRVTTAASSIDGHAFATVIQSAWSDLLSANRSGKGRPLTLQP